MLTHVCIYVAHDTVTFPALILFEFSSNYCNSYCCLSLVVMGLVTLQPSRYPCLTAASKWSANIQMLAPHLKRKKAAEAAAKAAAQVRFAGVPVSMYVVRLRLKYADAILPPQAAKQVPKPRSVFVPAPSTTVSTPMFASAPDEPFMEPAEQHNFVDEYDPWRQVLRSSIACVDHACALPRKMDSSKS